MNDVAHRLREWVESHYDSVGAFAKACEISIALASHYLNGVTRPGNKMQSKLRALGCDIEWLMTGVTAKGNQNFNIGIDLVQIPVFHYARLKGETMFIREQPVEYVYTARSADKTLYGLKAKGSDMVPEVKDGEIVIASKIVAAADGDLCIVHMANGDMLIRRVYTGNGIYTLTCENKSIPPAIHKKKEVHSVHRIVEKVTKY
ncbi:MAG: XRE family transcriptional regulator [Bacteroidota bacterium]